MKVNVGHDQSESIRLARKLLDADHNYVARLFKCSMKTADSILKRLTENMTKSTPEGCVEWRGSSIQFIYTQLDGKRRSTTKRRAVYCVANNVPHDSIPDGSIVCCKYGNFRCVNPDHVVVRPRKTELAESVPPPIRSKMLKMRQEGAALWQIAEKFGVGLSTVKSVLNHERVE